MKPIAQTLSLTACAFAAAMLVSACGGGSGSSPADTTPPTVVITDNVSASTATSTVVFTFTFSEDIKDSSFTLGDVSVSGGTAGALAKVSAKVYTLEVTPAVDASGTVSVSVASARFDDLAGNSNTATASASQAYNTVPVAALTFASGYTALADPSTVGYAYQGTSTEGGAFNWTVANGATFGWDGSEFWWSGVASTDATPNFYWGGKGKADQDYMESWVNAPANSSLQLNGQTKLRVTVWGNKELVGSPRFTPVIQLGETGGCYPRAEASPITPASDSDVDAIHNVDLNSFTVVEDCGLAMTTAEFMGKPIASVRIRIYKANYYNPGNTFSSPNGINLGPISFQP